MYRGRASEVGISSAPPEKARGPSLFGTRVHFYMIVFYMIVLSILLCTHQCAPLREGDSDMGYFLTYRWIKKHSSKHKYTTKVVANLKLN